MSGSTGTRENSFIAIFTYYVHMGFFGSSSYEPPTCGRCRVKKMVVDTQPASADHTEVLLKCPECGEGGKDIV